MARFVAEHASDSLELQNLTDRRYWGEIVVGGLDSRPTVRGTNTVVPGRPGQTYRPKRQHEFPLTIRLFVSGVSGTPYLTVMDDLHEVFLLGAEVDLTLHPDATGVGGRVPAGSIATTTVEVLRFTGLPAAGDEVRVVEIECAGITDPLGWTVAAS